MLLLLAACLTLGVVVRAKPLAGNAASASIPTVCAVDTDCDIGEACICPSRPALLGQVPPPAGQATPVPPARGGSSTKCATAPSTPAVPGFGADCSGACINGNRGYASLQQAWTQCADTAGCSHVMAYTDSKFYLRKSNDAFAAGLKGWKYTCAPRDSVYRTPVAPSSASCTRSQRPFLLALGVLSSLVQATWGSSNSHTEACHCRKLAAPTTTMAITTATQCNWQCYLNRYADLQRAYGVQGVQGAASHYKSNGSNEGRDCTCPTTTVVTTTQTTATSTTATATTPTTTTTAAAVSETVLNIDIASLTEAEETEIKDSDPGPEH